MHSLSPTPVISDPIPKPFIDDVPSSWRSFGGLIREMPLNSSGSMWPGRRRPSGQRRDEEGVWRSGLISMPSAGRRGGPLSFVVLGGGGRGVTAIVLANFNLPNTGARYCETGKCESP